MLALTLVALITASLLLRVMVRAADHVLGIREITPADRDAAERMGWRIRARDFPENQEQSENSPETC